MEKQGISKLDHDFVTKATESGLAEVELAKVAKQKASSAEVREYADKLQSDHKKATDKLLNLVKGSGIDVPKRLSESHRMLIDRMSKIGDDRFEREFMTTQIKEHESDIKLYRSEAEHGGNDELKKLAAETADLLQKHVEMARTIHNRLG